MFLTQAAKRTVINPQVEAIQKRAAYDFWSERKDEIDNQLTKLEEELRTIRSENKEPSQSFCKRRIGVLSDAVKTWQRYIRAYQDKTNSWPASMRATVDKVIDEEQQRLVSYASMHKYFTTAHGEPYGRHQDRHISKEEAMNYDSGAAYRWHDYDKPNFETSGSQ